MSVITSGTPNYLWYIKMHKLIITVIVTLSVRTLRFENNADMTETNLRSITNSGTWMPILAPTYSTKIFYRSNRITTYVVPFVIGMLLARDSIVGISIPSSISLLESLFTHSVIHHPITNSLVTLLARLVVMCITEGPRDTSLIHGVTNPNLDLCQPNKHIRRHL